MTWNPPFNSHLAGRASPHACDLSVWCPSTYPDPDNLNVNPMPITLQHFLTHNQK